MVINALAEAVNKRDYKNPEEERGKTKDELAIPCYLHEEVQDQEIEGRMIVNCDHFVHSIR
jgi:hypothetical protein